MTASQLAKYHGFSSLKEVAELSGKTVVTLNDWHNNNPALFKAVLIGFKVLDWISVEH